MVLKLILLAVLATSGVWGQLFDACHEKNHEVVEREDWRWRHNKIHPDHEKPQCDSFKTQAWRRFKAESGEDLVNRCPPKHSCGTRHPIWMNGTLPKESDGEVRRTACLHKDDKCCAEVFTLTVKNCGNFRVYKFDVKPQQPDCDKAYCVGDKKPCDDDDEGSSSSEEGKGHMRGKWGKKGRGGEDDSEEEGRHGKKHRRHHKKGSSSSEEGSSEEGEGKCYNRNKRHHLIRMAMMVGAAGLTICLIIIVTLCCVSCCRRRRRGRAMLVPHAPMAPTGYVSEKTFSEKPPLDTQHVVCVDMKRPLFDSLESTYATLEPEEKKGPVAEKYEVEA